MIKISENANVNYLAKVIKLGTPRKHTNADRLLCWNIDFQNVITNLEYKEGDIVVYFPIECEINKDFVTSFNGLDKPEFNKDGVTKGFFSYKTPRVKAISLRGEKSQGFIIKVSELNNFFNIDTDDWKNLIGKPCIINTPGPFM